MKKKLSLTLDKSLVSFLDGLAGPSRSAKLERVLREFRNVREEMALRRALARVKEDEAERLEREAWVRTMEQTQWSESGEERSGRSNS